MSTKMTVGYALAVPIVVLSDVKMFSGQQQPGRNAHGYERCEQATPEHAAHLSALSGEEEPESNANWLGFSRAEAGQERSRPAGILPAFPARVPA